MLDVILEQDVFIDFIKKEPGSVITEKEEDIQLWNSFWNFIKSHSNLQLANFDLDPGNPYSVFLNGLTTGRGDSKINSIEFKKPYKEILKLNNDNTVLFLDEEDESTKKKYREKNSYVFGFVEDYLSQWEKLSYLKKKKTIPVRKNISNGFINWDNLSEYITPFDEILIVDSYIFSDSSLLQSNLYKILYEFRKHSKKGLKITIVSSIGNNNQKIDVTDLHNKLKKLKNENIINKVNIILCSIGNKEHDRNIITKYFRIKSGDTFNYFNSKNDIITKGTEIEFISHVNSENYNNTKVVFDTVIDRISRVDEKYKILEFDIGLEF